MMDDADGGDEMKSRQQLLAGGSAGIVRRSPHRSPV